MKNSSSKSRGRSYQDLLIAFPPRLITSKSGLKATVRVIEALLDKEHLTEDEEEYKNLLTTLVDIYEEEHFPISDIHGVDVLKALMQERSLRQKDLVHIFKTKSVASEVLSGRRELTSQYIQRLADYFSVSPSTFYPSQAHKS